MRNCSIKDLEILSGINAHTIRIWEKRYNLLSPQRSSTNIRTYSAKQLKYLLNVALLVNNNHKISKVATYANVKITEKVLRIRSKIFTPNNTINRLMDALLEFNELDVNRIVNNYIKNHSLKQCVNEIMFPFMKRIGIFWQLEKIIPAEEHFISNLFRQKIIGAIDRLPLKNSLPKYTLFLPDGEWHEIGL